MTSCWVLTVLLCLAAQSRTVRGFYDNTSTYRRTSLKSLFESPKYRGPVHWNVLLRPYFSHVARPPDVLWAFPQLSSPSPPRTWHGRILRTWRHIQRSMFDTHYGSLPWCLSGAFPLWYYLSEYEDRFGILENNQRPYDIYNYFINKIDCCIIMFWVKCLKTGFNVWMQSDTWSIKPSTCI